MTVVLAYLIHANAWTLKMSYAYVAERRKGISPNIGFVAELMQFEESELGLRQSGGVHGEASAGRGGRHQPKRDDDSDSDREDGSRSGQGTSSKGKGGGGKYTARYARESLPPAWAQSLDTYPRPTPLHSDEGEQGSSSDGGRKPVADEREVRKHGHWVQQRR